MKRVLLAVSFSCLFGLFSSGVFAQQTQPATQPASAPAEKSGPMKVLFIGNSYTGFCNMTTLVELLSAAMDPARPIKADQVSPGGMLFEEHWNIPERAKKKGVTENGSLKAIQKGGWDVIVLQAYTDVVQQPDNFQKYGRLLAEEVKKTGARLVFYETWPFKKPTAPSPEALAKYNAQYFSLAKATGGTVSPVGIAFELVKTRKPELGTKIHYGGGDEHPSYEGAYLIACTHVATIYGKSPVGLPAELYKNEGDKKAGKPLIKLDPDFAKFLQEVSADAIAESKKIAATMPAATEVK